MSLTPFQNHVCTFAPVLFLFFSLFRFYVGHCLHQSPHLPQSKSCPDSDMSVAEGTETWCSPPTHFVKVTIETSSKTHNHWILFRGSNCLSYQAMSSTCTCNHLLYIYSNFINCLRFRFYLDHFPHQLPHLPQSKSRTGNHVSMVEWTDTYGIHHWRFFLELVIES